MVRSMLCPGEAVGPAVVVEVEEDAGSTAAADNDMVVEDSPEEEAGSCKVPVERGLEAVPGADHGHHTTSVVAARRCDTAHSRPDDPHHQPWVRVHWGHRQPKQAQTQPEMRRGERDTAD